MVRPYITSLNFALWLAGFVLLDFVNFARHLNAQQMHGTAIKRFARFGTVSCNVALNHFQRILFYQLYLYNTRNK